MSATTRRDAIDRALMHHQLAGVVHTYSPPEQHGDRADRRSFWRIVFADRQLEPIECNAVTAWAVCVALASAEQHHAAQVDALRHVVTALADVEIGADDSAAFERAERALLAAADVVGGRS